MVVENLVQLQILPALSDYGTYLRGSLAPAGVAVTQLVGKNSIALGLALVLPLAGIVCSVLSNCPFHSPR